MFWLGLSVGVINVIDPSMIVSDDGAHNSAFASSFRLINASYRISRALSDQRAKKLA